MADRLEKQRRLHHAYDGLIVDQNSSYNRGLYWTHEYCRKGLAPPASAPRGYDIFITGVGRLAGSMG